MRCVRIGLISDTHNLLRAEAVQALAGASRIIHAGDICGPDILHGLGRIAPVSAVRGNNDHGAWAHALPHTTVIQAQEVSILVVHDLATLDVDPKAAGVRVVIAGHSHRPSLEERDGVLYVNPGSAGPRRFRLPVCVAELRIHGREVQASLSELRIAG